jgi:hypothetical protein
VLSRKQTQFGQRQNGDKYFVENGLRQVRMAGASEKQTQFAADGLERAAAGWAARVAPPGTNRVKQSQSAEGPGLRSQQRES